VKFNAIKSLIIRQYPGESFCSAVF